MVIASGKGRYLKGNFKNHFKEFLQINCKRYKINNRDDSSELGKCCERVSNFSGNEREKWYMVHLDQIPCVDTSEELTAC